MRNTYREVAVVPQSFVNLRNRDQCFVSVGYSRYARYARVCVRSNGAIDERETMAQRRVSLFILYSAVLEAPRSKDTS